jgi:hypothetical protein
LDHSGLFVSPQSRCDIAHMETCLRYNNVRLLCFAAIPLRHCTRGNLPQIQHCKTPLFRRNPTATLHMWQPASNTTPDVSFHRYRIVILHAWQPTSDTIQVASFHRNRGVAIALRQMQQVATGLRSIFVYFKSRQIRPGRLT